MWMSNNKQSLELPKVLFLQTERLDEALISKSIFRSLSDHKIALSVIIYETKTGHGFEARKCKIQEKGQSKRLNDCMRSSNPLG